MRTLSTYAEIGNTTHLLSEHIYLTLIAGLIAKPLNGFAIRSETK
jgi:hypothetical protein